MGEMTPHNKLIINPLNQVAFLAIAPLKEELFLAFAPNDHLPSCLAII
jgi:hypothetical protein